MSRLARAFIGRSLNQTRYLRVAGSIDIAKQFSVDCDAKIKVRQRVAGQPSDNDDDKSTVTYVASGDDWKRVDTTLVKRYELRDAIKHLMPSNFPASVPTYYPKYAIYCNVANLAGSTTMVLSTQTLLLAFGILSSPETAGVMAGAIHWILKDGVGQAGAILYTSVSSSNYDTNPKTWRMVAALSLDIAAGLELMVAPTEAGSFSRYTVLALACLSNALKNVGFLTASASRAALHQQLAISHNLADVTAKAGSQNILAGLLGTGLGLLLSDLLNHDVDSYKLAFFVLVGIHQSCNYLACQSVVFCHFNKSRLLIVLDHIQETGEIPSPKQVAKLEPILSLPFQYEWLHIGSKLLEHNVSPEEFSKLDMPFVLSGSRENMHLTFMEHASSSDCIQGVWAALRRRNQAQRAGKANIRIDRLNEAGWNTERIDLEPSQGVRLGVERQG